KPGQDLRADLPTIGPDTVKKAFAAKLKAVAVHSGRSLIADLETTKQFADEHRITLMGIDPESFVDTAP
ncbi:MAG: UDP-2,3-diacylglucosamine diphosphatase LpxI, partial [Pseudomonadota bacterium]